MIAENSPGKPRGPVRRAVVDAAALAALALLTLAFFWKIALTDQVLSGIDLFSYFYPYRQFASEALRSGHLPLWNPYLFMGAPLLANSQVAVLYPLHWPFIALSAPKQVAWSIVLHIWLAGSGTYLLLRWVMRRRPLASLVGAAVLAFGGFLGAQVEHINQLNASAWLPWLLISLEKASSRPTGLRSCLAFLLGSAVVSLVLLAGHTQAAYIVIAAAGCYSLLRAIPEGRAAGWRQVLYWLRGPAILAGMAVVALFLSAGQLLPTAELSRLSVRSGGLEYREAVSFSLKPGETLRAFLSPLAWQLPSSTEVVAYVGICGLALAGSGAFSLIQSLRRRSMPPHLQQAEVSDPRPFALPALGLTFLGVFLAFGAYNPVYYILYKTVPGISLFRAPARWLLLYAFGVAILAAFGFDRLASARWTQGRLGRVIPPFAALLLLTELLISGRRLAYNQPTAPAAYDSMRSAPAHLLSSARGGPFRFLSLSDILYDPGDLTDLHVMFSRDLSEEALYQLIVATKMKEVLAYNLPLRYRLFSVDGYDGGLLPTARYVTLEHLFLRADEIWPDGRLRQQLSAIPPVRLLSLLNVRYIITDKLQDAWHEGVYYDLEAKVSLEETDLSSLPACEATQVGIVTYLTDARELPTGTPVAEVVVEAGDSIFARTLRAGYDTAEGLYDAAEVAHAPGVVIHNWRGNSRGNDYLAVMDLGQAVRPDKILLRTLLPAAGTARVVLRGVSLIDARTGTSASVSIDPCLELVHSGDVKVYENLAVLPRAFVVHEARYSEDAGALSLLQDPALDPAQEVILAPLPPAADGQPGAPAGSGASQVELLSYRPEQIDLSTSLDSPGFLVLTEAYYPGWHAEVDGERVPILRADVYFRAVALDAGEHAVTFTYRPASVRWGLGIGSAAWIAWLLALAGCISVFWRT